MSENIGISQTSIRITGLNKDKTRRADTSNGLYHVYFELSEIPPQEWKQLFDEQWKIASAATVSKKKMNDAAIDRGFLTVLCSLSDVASIYLPELKKAIAAANILFDQYEEGEEKKLKDREQVWIDERNAIDELEKTLKFS